MRRRQTKEMEMFSGSLGKILLERSNHMLKDFLVLGFYQSSAIEGFMFTNACELQFLSFHVSPYHQYWSKDVFLC